jgi:hypothetical protein
MISRILTDYKVAGGNDGKFVVNINARKITDFKKHQIIKQPED